MTAATVLLDGYSLAVLDIEARRRKISVPELVVSFFDKRCNAPHTTRRAAVSAQGRASQEAGSAQGRDDRGKTHTEARDNERGAAPNPEEQSGKGRYAMHTIVSTGSPPSHTDGDGGADAQPQN